MADVNEEIVAQYLELALGWLYAVDVPFRVNRGHSNIDLIAHDPQNDRFYDIEVKYRSAFSLSATTKSGRNVASKSVQPLVSQFSGHSERDSALERFTGGRKPRKLLVTTRQYFGKGDDRRRALESAFKRALAKQGYPRAEVWYFEDIVQQLWKSVAESGRYNTELLQTIRMLKLYLEEDQNAKQGREPVSLARHAGRG